MSARIARSFIVRTAASLPGVLVFLACLVLPSSGGAGVVLSTGSEVPGLGAIGEYGFDLLDMDEDGRALIFGRLSDGRYGFFWVGDDSLETLWLLAGEVQFLPIRPARASRNGLAVAVSHEYADPRRSAYRLGAGQPERIISTGESDSGGNTLCWIETAAINDNGIVALEASVARTAEECDEDAGEAIYLVTEGGLELVDSGPEIRLLDVTADGAAVYAKGGDGSTAVLSALGELRTELVAEGTIGPSGTPLTSVTALASRGGEVVFSANEQDRYAIYRTQRRNIVRVVAYDETPPGGGEFRSFRPEFLRAPTLNEVGDVVVVAEWEKVSAEGRLERLRGAILYPVVGQPRIIVQSGPDEIFGGQYLRPRGELAINVAGQVAFVVDSQSNGGTFSALLRWQDGGPEELLRTGDPAVEGALFAVGGFHGTFDGQTCLAADGGIFTTVQGVDGTRALVCVDGAGPRAIVRGGDPEPTGRTFYDVTYGDCSFTYDGQLVFSASTLRPVERSDGPTDFYVEAAIYRAGPDGIERLVGAGDRTNEGATLELHSGVTFSANSAGDVLVYSASTDGFGHFLRDAAGIRKLFSGFTFETVGGEVVQVTSDLALTDRGDIMMLGRFGYPTPYDANAVVEWSDGETRIIAASDDLASDGLTYGAIKELFVRGDAAVFLTSRRLTDGRGRQDRLFLYSPDTPAPRLVFAGGTGEDISFRDLRVVGINSHGDVTFESFVPQAGSGIFVVRPGGIPQFVRDRTGAAAHGVNEQGTVFSTVYEYPFFGGYRATLKSDLGVVAGTSCSRLPQPPPRTPTPTRTPTPFPTSMPPGVPTGTVATTATPLPTEAQTPLASPCPGDCDHDAAVSVGELVMIVNIALARMNVSTCSASDIDSDGLVAIDEMVSAVGRSMAGCN